MFSTLRIAVLIIHFLIIKRSPSVVRTTLYPATDLDNRASEVGKMYSRDGQGVFQRWLWCASEVGKVWFGGGFSVVETSLFIPRWIIFILRSLKKTWYPIPTPLLLIKNRFHSVKKGGNLYIHYEWNSKKMYVSEWIFFHSFWVLFFLELKLFSFILLQSLKIF